MWDMTNSHVGHYSFVCAISLVHMCDMTHSHMWNDSSTYVTWIIHRSTSHHVINDMCDRTHSYVRHDSFICATWLIHMCNMMHSYVQHNSFVSVLIIHVCHMTHLCLICDMTHSYVRYIWISFWDVTHSYAITELVKSIIHTTTSHLIHMISLIPYGLVFEIGLIYMISLIHTTSSHHIVIHRFPRDIFRRPSKTTRGVTPLPSTPHFLITSLHKNRVHSCTESPRSFVIVCHQIWEWARFGDDQRSGTLNGALSKLGYLLALLLELLQCPRALTEITMPKQVRKTNLDMFFVTQFKKRVWNPISTFRA